MKTFTKEFLKKLTIITGLAAISSTHARATVYTAIASGNYSSASTWSGGNVPPATLLADNVVIPSGINVMLDQSETINGTLSTFTVDGTLTSSSSASNALIVNLGSIAGSGTVTVDSIVMQLSTGFSFTGSLIATNFTSLGTTMASTANITVSKHLWLNGGVMNLLSGNLSLSGGATIVLSGGTITNNGGTFNLSNAYNVMYTGSASASAGLELSGTGLRKMIVDMSNAASVALSADLNVTDTMMLNSGALWLNNHNLTFSGNGNFSASGTGTISSGNLSDITITAANSFDGGLRFTAGGNTVGNFIVNTANTGRTIRLGSDLMVSNMLSLQNGNLDLQDNMLTIGASGSVSGGSANSYVITGMNGGLAMTLNAGNSNTYHIGTAGNYTPAVVMANSGSASGTVSVATMGSIYADGTSGTVISADQPVVNNTWFVHSSATANLDLNLQLMWAGAMEVNSFDRNNAYLSHYTNGSWDASTAASATTATNGMFMLSRNNITSLSPFAVMGKNAVTTSVNELAMNNDGIVLYPNPANATLNFTTGKVTGLNELRIYDVAGHLVKIAPVNANTNAVSLADLQSGFYTVHFYGNNDYTSVQKFIKE